MKSIFRILARAAFVCVALGFSFHANAASKLSIKNQQSLPESALKIQAPGTVQPDQARQGGAAAERAMMEFRAFGRAFRLELESNEQLIENLNAADRARMTGQLKMFRGRLAGNNQSWARINQLGDKLSGMIWDGKEIFVIDSSDEIADLAGSTLGTRARHSLIYRLKDAAFDAQCALDPHSASLADYDALVQELRERAKALPQGEAPQGASATEPITLAAATRQLAVAIVADPLFVQANSGDVQGAVLARMNVVDGIFSSQVGVALKVTAVQQLSANGTLTATAASTLLNQFGLYVGSASFTNPGIAHLFTGRQLDGSTAGIAYLDSICSKRYGSGVSEVRGTGTAGALIVAHEIGHNFGAPHDNQSGSPCASTPGTFLMNPFIGSSNNSFSSCSLTQMAPSIAAATCLTSVGGGGGGGGAVSLRVSPTSVASGGSVTATWSGITGASGADWIGLHRPGVSSQTILNWMYVNCTRSATSARASGSCTFPIPAGLAAGTYQLRLHRANGYTVIATSGALTVTGSVSPPPPSTGLSINPSTVARGTRTTVTWSGVSSATSTHWIGLYRRGADARSFIDWIYMSCSKTAGRAIASGSCPFTIPATLAAGTYEFRMNAANGYTQVLNTVPVTVQ